MTTIERSSCWDSVIATFLAASIAITFVRKYAHVPFYQEEAPKCLCAHRDALRAFLRRRGVDESSCPYLAELSEKCAELSAGRPVVISPLPPPGTLLPRRHLLSGIFLDA